MSDLVDNPFFARLWMTISGHEPESLRRLRVANLAGLTGRVLEVGAGTGTNFAHYPAGVTEVIALEPERRLAEVARAAAAVAPVPVIVSTAVIEEFNAEQSFDAVVCSLVLCSVDDPDSVVRELYSMLKPGGELRYLEHVAGVGLRGTLQKAADATVWPRLLGNCHTHRNTEASIAAAGFSVDRSRREQTLPGWLPIPVSEFAIGRAVRP
ncbi:class I SAM-dependent methyltransferase [Mycolicibacterium sp. P9-22]|uniref:class I SAM-dependent methyltransferase n=1 Tax=Mycolicibacterium sp. P9-22 TaxID=2024613 RepID=UPI0011EBE749|nr:class I SAM-dependent methyltransferase [Mycolicibacterium sp. P9-22]KAA0113724.1 class I SAM-dependent methyltransferase [Mycolicibacterium sp. P9-22]